MGTADAVFSVRLAAPCRLPVSVNYATDNGTAMAGEDYIPASGTLVFAPGTTIRTLTVKVISDNIFEPTETFFVNLFSAVNADIAVASGRARINNDDPLPSLSIDDVAVTEGPPGGTNSAVFTVRLAGLSSLPVSVDFVTQDGTANAGLDYVAQSGTLTFAP